MQVSVPLIPQYDARDRQHQVHHAGQFGRHFNSSISACNALSQVKFWTISQSARTQLMMKTAALGITSGMHKVTVPPTEWLPGLAQPSSAQLRHDPHRHAPVSLTNHHSRPARCAPAVQPVQPWALPTSHLSRCTCAPSPNSIAPIADPKPAHSPVLTCKGYYVLTGRTCLRCRPTSCAHHNSGPTCRSARIA